MGFRFQKRLKLGKGLGINVGKKGPSSVSYRGKHGSIGTSGFSIKTGIPGLSFRQSFSKRPLLFIAASILLVVPVVVIGSWKLIKRFSRK
ncbi:MAG: DUF4236 domain-containing protein [Endozoicomonas sp.]|uniref:DUF4236 domain-containing protein n=1 Tax=Endozoicomonas sp. TaxID=1892382 RepID=UPI003D9BBA0E